MIKQTLYGAVAAGALALAAATPAISAPAAKAVPQAQSNVTDAQYYYYDGPRYRRHHRHYRHYGYRHYEPGVGVYVAPGFGVRTYHW